MRIRNQNDLTDDQSMAEIANIRTHEQHVMNTRLLREVQNHSKQECNTNQLIVKRVKRPPQPLRLPYPCAAPPLPRNVPFFNFFNFVLILLFFLLFAYYFRSPITVFFFLCLYLGTALPGLCLFNTQTILVSYQVVFLNTFLNYC